MQVAAVCRSDVAGGAERYLANLYIALGDLGTTGTLVGSVPGWSSTGLPRRPVRLGPKWAGLRSAPQVLRLPGEIRRVGRAIDGLRPDLVHLQYEREMIGFSVALADRAPVVWTVHGAVAPSRTGLVPAGLRRAARAVALVVCVSDSVAERLTEVLGIGGPEVVVVPNAVDTAVLTPPDAGRRAAARAALGIRADVPVLAWVARTDPTKLPLFAAEVGHAFPGITLLAGTGELGGAVAAASDGEQVRYLGHLQDPTPVYDAADAFLFTSTGAFEGHPLAILEAAAHGLPVFANAGSGFGDLANEAGGEPVPDGDARAAARRIAAAVASGAGRDTARTWAVGHDVRPWAARYLELFSAVLR